MKKRKWLAYVLLIVMVCQSMFIDEGKLLVTHAKSQVTKGQKIVESSKKTKNRSINAETSTKDTKEATTKRDPFTFQNNNGLTSGDVTAFTTHKISKTEAKKAHKYEPLMSSASLADDTYNFASTYGRTNLGNNNLIAIYDLAVAACKSFQTGSDATTEIHDIGDITRHAAYRLDVSRYNLGTDDAYHIMASVDYDNPQFFWLEKGFFAYTQDDKVQDILIICGADYKEASVRQLLDESMKTRIDEYLSCIDASDSSYEKELKIHDKLIETVEYAYSNSAPTQPETALWAHSIIGVFGPADVYHNKVVCEGYAKAFQLLMNSCGIETILVVGLGDGGEHAWNLVKLGTDWYGVDVTWDDQEDDAFKHNYFNKNSTNFGSHISNGGSNWCYVIPTYTGTNYSYTPIEELKTITYTSPDDASIKLYKSGTYVPTNTKVASGSAITVEVTPHSTTNDYTVSYRVNGGESRVLTRTVNSNNNVVYKSDTPFVMANADTTVTVSLVLIPKYSVTFNNDGTVYHTSNNIVSGNTVSDWPTDPMKAAYVFGGWYTSNSYTPESKITDQTPINANTTVYAQWIPKVYTRITAQYNNNGAPIPKGSRIDKAKFIIRKYYNNSESNYDDPGFNFTITPETIDHVGANDIRISFNDTDLTTVVTLQGYEDIIYRTVSFNTEGADTSVPTISNIVDGSTITLPAKPRRSGYYFDDWYLTDNYQTKFNPITPINQDYTLYARWIRLLDDPTNTIRSVAVTYSGGNVYVGNTISTSDIRMIVTDKNGETHQVTDFTLSQSRIDRVGNNTITATYGGFSGTFVVNGISTTSTTPTVSRYMTNMIAGYYGGPVEVGSTVDLNNITVTVVYSDNSVEFVQGFSVSNPYIYSTGNNTVYVYYGGYSYAIIVPGVAKGSLNTTTPATPVKSKSVVSSSSSISLSSIVTGGYLGYVSPKLDVTQNLNYAIVSAEIEEKAIASAASGKDISNTNMLKLSINNISSQVLTQLYKSNVSEVYLNICMPIQYLGRSDIQLADIPLDSATIARLNDSNKKLVVQYIGTAYNADTDKTTYTNPLCSMIIDGKNLTQRSACNASIRVSSLERDYEVESAVNDYLNEEDRGMGAVVTLGQNGELRSAGKVIADVGGSLACVKGDKVYVYGYNEETGKLEELPKTQYVVDKNQNITLEVESYSKYVILPDETDQPVISIASRATVSKLMYAKKGKKKQITVTMPEGISISDVKLKYSSSDKKKATVSKTGKVTTKKKGKVVITTTVTYANKSKKYKTTIEVK